MITITAKNAAGKIIAEARHGDEALLCFDGAYGEGDCSRTHPSFPARSSYPTGA